MDRCLLDTDTVSEIFRARNMAVRDNYAMYIATHGRMTVSAPTVYEITSGYQRVARPDALKQFLLGLTGAEILALDYNEAELAGRIHGELLRRGTMIGVFDPMIAAIALTHGITLVTGNTDHYRRIQDIGYELKLDNWRNESI